MPLGAVSVPFTPNATSLVTVNGAPKLKLLMSLKAISVAFAVKLPTSLLPLHKL